MNIFRKTIFEKYVFLVHYKYNLNKKNKYSQVLIWFTLNLVLNKVIIKFNSNRLKKIILFNYIKPLHTHYIYIYIYIYLLRKD